jgi:hypothetical protein
VVELMSGGGGGGTVLAMLLRSTVGALYKLNAVDPLA